MADKTTYLCAETGTLTGSTITLSGSVISGQLAAQLFADALSDGDTVTITVADASTPTTFAVYSGVPFTASGTTLNLSSGTLLDSSGTLGSSVNVLGFVVPGKDIYADTTNHCVAVGAPTAAAWMAATSNTYYSVAIGEGALAATPTSTDAKYNVANGYRALYVNESGRNNIANGAYCLLSNTSGSNNIANGYAALYNNNASNNIANGYQALFSNTTGTPNVANGNSALRENISGSNNVANGSSALQKNTTGSNNVANGTNALYNNTVGSNNIANGFATLYSNTSGNSNIANGYQALFNNTAPSFCIAEGHKAAWGPSSYSNQGCIYIGYQCGYSADNGSDFNTLIGYQSGYSLTTGAYNISIGQNVDLPSATTDQQLNIGNLLYGTGIYNGATVSSTPVSSGKVGIMTDAPTGALDINGNTIRLRSSKTPASATATGNAGEIAWDSGYVYVCVATDTWKRAALSTW